MTDDKRDMLIRLIKHKGMCITVRNCGGCPLLHDICKKDMFEYSENKFSRCLKEYANCYGERALKEDLIEVLI